jgi:hypothetical protein
MSESIIQVRRLPGLPGTTPTMRFEQLDGEVMWEAPMDERIEEILDGRWSCKLLIRVERGEAEVLGEALE